MAARARRSGRIPRAPSVHPARDHGVTTFEKESTIRALVVYESMFGNTHVIADHIATGLRTQLETTIAGVHDATHELVESADLVVVGGPTHVHGMTSQRVRDGAKDMAAKDSDLHLDPDAEGPGTARLVRRTPRWAAGPSGGIRHTGARHHTRDRPGVQGHHQTPASPRVRTPGRARELLRGQVESPGARRGRSGRGMGPHACRNAGSSPQAEASPAASTRVDRSRAARCGRTGRRRRRTADTGTRSA